MRIFEFCPRRIAQKRGVLAETIATRTEIIFILPEKSLPEILSLFSS